MTAQLQGMCLQSAPGDRGTASTVRFRTRLSLQSHEEVSIMLFAYVGPETMLPLASILAGAVGVLLMFGRNVMMFGRKMVRGVRALAGRR